MDKKLFYIVGLRSTGVSSTYLKVKEKYNNIELIVYDVRDYKTENDILDYIKGIVGNIPKEDLVLIGNSFGARLAYQLSDICDNMLLINIPLAVFSDEHPDGIFDNFTKNTIFNNNSTRVLHILSEDDEVVNTKEIEKMIESGSIVGEYYKIKDGHRIKNEESINMIYSLIEVLL